MARQTGAEVAVKSGDVSLEFGQVHVRRHVNSGEREPRQLGAEAAPDVHEGALEASLLRHLHLARGYRRRIAKRIGQSPYWFTRGILQQTATLGDFSPRQFRTLQRKDRMVQGVRTDAHTLLHELPQVVAVE